MRRLLALLCLLVLLPAHAWAQKKALPPLLREIDLEQRLNEQVPADLEFRDDTGRAVRLGDYFDGKPLILVLAQYRCPMLCNQVLNGLLDALKGIPWNAGEQFHVVIVSFDAREGTELAAAKKASYVENYGRPHAADGWHFLTGEQTAIDRLTGAVGFRYAYDAKHDQFAHASGILVLTPQGRIARCFFGIEYPTRDVRLALVEASGGKIGSPADRVLLLCFHYDPASGKYTPAVMNFVRAGGALTLVGLGTFLLWAWRRERHSDKGGR